MNKPFMTTRVIQWRQYAQCVMMAALVAALACAAVGQTRLPASSGQHSNQGRDESRSAAGQTQVSTVDGAPRIATAEAERAPRTGEADDPFFAPIYRNFYDTYRLGPGDVLALRVAQQPDYTVERAKVSPVGRVYHPLLGDVEVAGLTVGQVLERFSRDLGEYLLNPKVSVELVEANSAKIGVLGEVNAPGIIVMARPMTVMDAIAAAGGVTDTGSKSNIALLRQAGGRLVETRINLKRLLEGKSSLEENLTLRAGDTLIVRGNARKGINEALSLTGFAHFITFLTRY